MKTSGILRKMSLELNGEIKYYFHLNGGKDEEVNACLGKEFELKWTGEIHCINCGKSIKKTYQGFCYDCFTTAPQAAPCIVKPELCEAHLGKGRDVAWEESHHNQPHFVYLAQTSSVKVGVTRTTQIPTRWIDQGAWRTIIIAETPYRKLAGDIEIELKQYLSDRTDWRQMLVNTCGEEDLEMLRDQMISFLPADLSKYALSDAEVNEFSYPVPKYPKKVSSINLDKEKTASGTLMGIRGQYLFFDEGRVINLRKYSGYSVEINCS